MGPSNGTRMIRKLPEIDENCDGEDDISTSFLTCDTPNPVSDHLHIVVCQQRFFRSSPYDLCGRKLLDATLNNQISLSEFSNGFYLLEINDPRNSKTSYHKVLLL